LVVGVGQEAQREVCFAKKKKGGGFQKKIPRSSGKKKSAKEGKKIFHFISQLFSRPKKMKIVLVSGGGVSGLGKGLASANIGVLLQSAGLCVSICKIEPYLV